MSWVAAGGWMGVGAGIKVKQLEKFRNLALELTILLCSQWKQMARDTGFTKKVGFDKCTIFKAFARRI